MGVSTDGQICYGILYDEGYNFPWDNDDYGGGIDEWWLKVNGYVPHKSHDEVYVNGDYRDEYKNDTPEREKKINEWLEHRREFEKEHPMPISLVNYCSGDCPMYIIAIEKTEITCNRGYPEELDLSKMGATCEDIVKLFEFCKKYLPRDDNKYEPTWYLSSYWG